MQKLIGELTRDSKKTLGEEQLCIVRIFPLTISASSLCHRTSYASSIRAKWRNSLTHGISAAVPVQRLSLTHDNRIVWCNRARNRSRQTPSISSKTEGAISRLNTSYRLLSCLCKRGREGKRERGRKGEHVTPYVSFHSFVATITSPVDSRRPAPNDSPNGNPHPQPPIGERKEGLTVYTSDHPSLLLRL